MKKGIGTVWKRDADQEAFARRQSRKRRTALIAIFLTIAFGVTALLSSCKKEKKPCGSCDYKEHYSHNDSTFTIPGNPSCGELLEERKSYHHVYVDTVNGQPTTIDYYYICTDQ